MLVIWSIKNVGVGWGGGGVKKNFFGPPKIRSQYLGSED